MDQDAFDPAGEIDEELEEDLGGDGEEKLGKDEEDEDEFGSEEEGF